MDGSRERERARQASHTGGAGTGEHIDLGPARSWKTNLSAFIFSRSPSALPLCPSFA